MQHTPRDHESLKLPTTDVDSKDLSKHSPKVSSKQNRGFGDRSKQKSLNSKDSQLLESACELGKSAKFAEAREICQQLARRHPKHPSIEMVLGLICFHTQQIVLAQRHWESALTHSEDQLQRGELFSLLGKLFYHQAEFAKAAEVYLQAIALEPTNQDTKYNLALCWQKTNNIEKAIAIYRELLAQNPNYVRVYLQLGNIYALHNQLLSALANYQLATELQPNYPEAWFNLGVSYLKLQEHNLALQSLQTALNLKPNYGEAHNALGAVYEGQRQAKPCLYHYQKALELQPNSIQTLLNLAGAQKKLGAWQEAEINLRQIIALDPDNLSAISSLLSLLNTTCEWSAENAELSDRIWQLSQIQTESILLFNALHLPYSSQQHLYLAQRHCDNIELKTRELQHLLPESNRKESGRIRLGYLSGDFRNHAVAHLILRLFELSDRSQFEVYAYSLGDNDHSEYRQKLEQDADYFFDLLDHSPLQIARQIRQDQIDILIDLAGHTDYGSPEVLALRPAKIQVNYLGYPGTSGAKFIDYIIVDPTIVPISQSQWFTEKCAYLPHSYQINNNNQHIPTGDRLSLRTENDLPEDAFIYCCFNQSRKLDPVTFQTWIEILQAVPNSVLLLSESNAIAQQNLKNHFNQKGLDSKRLIFSPYIQAKSEHLERLQCADLCLDTRYYNAHTTGSDCLWVGVPIVTLIGETFAARVGASLLNAVGLSELITYDLSEYKALAIDLAQNPQRLANYGQKLKTERLQLPLFNTEQTVKYLESLFRLMWQKYSEQSPPQNITESELNLAQNTH